MSQQAAEQEVQEQAERLQRFLILRRHKGGQLDVIGTNGGLPFVEAAAEKHRARLETFVGGSYTVFEISKLGAYLNAHGQCEAPEGDA